MLQLLPTGKPLPWPVSPVRVPFGRRGLWAGLSLAWPLWDAGQRHAEDVSGFGFHGLFGSDLTEADWTATEDGPCLDFHNNSLEYLQVADPPSDRLDGCSALSGEITFIADDLSSFRGLLGKYRPSDGYRSWRFYLDAGQLELQVSSNGTSFEDKATTGLSLSTGALYQAVFTYDAGTFKVYLNGVSQTVSGDFSSQTSIFAGAQPFLVSQRRTSGDNAADTLDGRILSVRVWQRALSAEEVAELWEDPWGMYVPDFGIPAIVEHTGTAEAGPWILAGEALAGEEYFEIPDLQNGVEYDVQVKTVDETGNESDGSSIESATPAAPASTTPQIRMPPGAVFRVPPWRRP